MNLRGKKLTMIGVKVEYDRWERPSKCIDHETEAKQAEFIATRHQNSDQGSSIARGAVRNQEWGLRI